MYVFLLLQHAPTLTGHHQAKIQLCIRHIEGYISCYCYSVRASFTCVLLTTSPNMGGSSNTKPASIWNLQHFRTPFIKDGKRNCWGKVDSKFSADSGLWSFHDICHVQENNKTDMCTSTRVPWQYVHTGYKSFLSTNSPFMVTHPFKFNC